jgi:hypothetical protein
LEGSPFWIVEKHLRENMTANWKGAVRAILDDNTYNVTRYDCRKTGLDVEGVLVAQLCVERSNWGLLAEL